MMDRIIVTAADIEKLLAWRDEHKELVRSMPVPLREVKIQIVESGISIKCFRFDKKLKLYLDSPSRKLGHVVFAPLGNGLWKKKVSTLPADCNPAEIEQGALTVYGSLMALMAYGASEAPAATEAEHVYAWHISDLKIYDKPKSLSGFSRHDFRGMNETDVCGNESCEHYQPSGSYMLPPTCAINGCCLSKPPQSWCYVAEAEEDDAL